MLQVLGRRFALVITNPFEIHWDMESWWRFQPLVSLQSAVGMINFISAGNEYLLTNNNNDNHDNNHNDD